VVPQDFEGAVRGFGLARPANSRLQARLTVSEGLKLLRNLRFSLYSFLKAIEI
jgi:hypothetical protein